MAISLVNFSSASQQGGPFSTQTTTAQNVAPGNSLVMGTRWIAASVVDTAGNTYIPLNHLTGNPIANLGEGYHFWYCNNCIGSSSLQVTVNYAGTGVSLDTYPYVGVWNIAGGPLVLDSNNISVGNTGTTMTYGPFSTKYPNTIACLLFGSTANLNTCSVTAPLIQDGGSSLNGQQIGSAGHVIYTAMQSNQSLVATTSVSGTWEIGGPVFAAQPQQIPTRSRRRAAEAAVPPMFTGRMYNHYITLERLF